MEKRSRDVVAIYFHNKKEKKIYKTIRVPLSRCI